jgi:transcriptional regulator with XRE-family HTH domain
MKYRGESFSNLGSKIKAIRCELGMTQKELSEGIVTRNMLSRIENGEALPSLTTLSAIADRLSLPVGYLIDDRDDGTKLKNERLLAMIKKEFAAGNYSLCLQYLSGLEYFPEEKDVYTVRSMYLLGVEKMNACAPIKEAQILISDALKREELLEKHMINEGKTYRALLNGFQFSSESGNEVQVISEISKFAVSPSDISNLSRFIGLTEKSSADELMIASKISVFENPAYSSLTNAIIRIKQDDHKSAYSLLIEANTGVIPSPIRCYILSLLEKTSVSMSDFEKAYSYMEERKSLVSKLLKKV